MSNFVIEGPHKGAEVHPAASRYVAMVDSEQKPGDWRGPQFAHYLRSPEGFRLEGLSRSPTTLRTAR